MVIHKKHYQVPAINDNGNHFTGKLFGIRRGCHASRFNRNHVAESCFVSLNLFFVHDIDHNVQKVQRNHRNDTLFALFFSNDHFYTLILWNKDHQQTNQQQLYSAIVGLRSMKHMIRMHNSIAAQHCLCLLLHFSCHICSKRKSESFAFFHNVSTAKYFKMIKDLHVDIRQTWSSRKRNTSEQN